MIFHIDFGKYHSHPFLYLPVLYHPLLLDFMAEILRSDHPTIPPSFCQSTHQNFYKSPFLLSLNPPLRTSTIPACIPESSNNLLAIPLLLLSLNPPRRTSDNSCLYFRKLQQSSDNPPTPSFSQSSLCISAYSPAHSDIPIRFCIITTTGLAGGLL